MHHVMGCCPLEDLLAVVFAEPALEYLDLSYNRITDEAVPTLIKIIKGNHTLKELDLRGNPITSEGEKQLKEIPCQEGNLRIRYPNEKEPPLFSRAEDSFKIYV